MEIEVTMVRYDRAAKGPVVTFEGSLDECPMPDCRKAWIRRLAGWGETDGVVTDAPDADNIHWRIARASLAD
jgi:hypothetical protein